jgi:hypothetical protein
MKRDRNFSIVALLLLAAIIPGTAAALSVIAETRQTSAGDYPICTAPCECISENAAAMRWGAEGYEKCSKSICGQDADADIQYYCIHRVGSAVAAPAVTTTVPAPTLPPATVSTAAITTQVSTAAVPQTPLAGAVPLAGITTKSPAGAATILAALGIALGAFAAIRRK